MNINVSLRSDDWVVCSISECEDSEGLVRMDGEIDQSRRKNGWYTTYNIDLHIGDLTINYFDTSDEPDRIRCGADVLKMLERMFGQLSEVGTVSAAFKQELDTP